MAKLFFYHQQTNPDEISKLIDTLDPKKSTGPNGIPVFIIKALKYFFPSGCQN